MHTPIEYMSFNIRTSILSYGVSSFGCLFFLNGQYEASDESGSYIVVSGAKSVTLNSKLSYGFISLKNAAPSSYLT